MAVYGSRRSEEAGTRPPANPLFSLSVSTVLQRIAPPSLTWYWYAFGGLVGLYACRQEGEENRVAVNTGGVAAH